MQAAFPPDGPAAVLERERGREGGREGGTERDREEGGRERQTQTSMKERETDRERKSTRARTEFLFFSREWDITRTHVIRKYN